MRKPRSNRPKVKLPKTKAEPTLIRGAVVAVLALLASVGFTWAADVDKPTVRLIVAVVSLALPLLQALWTRYAVTPNAKVVARVSLSEGRVVLGEAGITPLRNVDGAPLTGSH